jgi:hypothetical protein
LCYHVDSEAYTLFYLLGNILLSLFIIYTRFRVSAFLLLPYCLRTRRAQAPTEDVLQNTLRSPVAPDSSSLDALCLAGNRDLLALTRPYTRIEVNLVLGANRNAGWRTKEQLRAFIADPAKVGAVRSLNISLAGPYTRPDALQILIQHLEAFINVTHLSFCCIRSRNVVGWSTPAHFVTDAVLFLPSLISITVIG